MTEGASAIVTETDLSDEFSGKGGAVLKNYRPTYSDGLSTLLEYETEVAALAVLNNYRDQLPFSIPQMLNYGLYDVGPDKDSPIAFIKMTKLNSVLSFNDVEGADSKVLARHAYAAGVTAAQIHQLNISVSDKEKLTRDAVEMSERRLRSHPMAEKHIDDIEQVISLMNSAEGEKVFVHGDLHTENLCAESVGKKITGVLDFACSGMGVKEGDFALYIGRGEDVESAFLKGYREVSDIPVNERNLEIIRALNHLYSKLYNELQLSKSLQKIDTLGDENLNVVGNQPAGL